MLYLLWRMASAAAATAAGALQGVAQQAAAHAAVVRFNFTGTQIISRQVEELRAVLAEVRRRQPGCKLFLLGRSLGGAAPSLPRLRTELSPA